MHSAQNANPNWQAWIEQLRKGPPENERALSTIVAEYYAPLCSYAFKILGSRDLAESAVLDVITSLWERRDSIEIRTTLHAYLVGAVRQRALNVARARLTESGWEDRAGLESHLPGMGTVPHSADSAALEHELQDIISSTVAQLPPRCREVFQMVWYAGLTYAETAAELNVSVKAVEGQMARAYKALREAVSTSL